MLSTDNKLLETAFDVFNSIYFNNNLPKTVITIQSSVKSFGYITVNEVWADGKSRYHEINISAEHLNRNIENVLATLLHEMVHLHCMINSIQDTSNGGRYHNKRFKEEAEKRDLVIQYVKYIGYSKTEPGERFVNILRENGLYKNINHCRTTRSLFASGSPGVSGGKKKSSTRKYICNSCGISVRATKDINIICGDCMDTMVKVD